MRDRNDLDWSAHGSHKRAPITHGVKSLRLHRRVRFMLYGNTGPHPAPCTIRHGSAVMRLRNPRQLWMDRPPGPRGLRSVFALCLAISHHGAFLSFHQAKSQLDTPLAYELGVTQKGSQRTRPASQNPPERTSWRPKATLAWPTGRSPERQAP